MSTTTLTTLPTQSRADVNETLTLEADVHNATRLLSVAASSLAEAYSHPADEPVNYEQAIHRFALANRLADNLTAIQQLIGSQQKECAAVILASHQHGENIDVEGDIFHRYDETKANGVSYKDLFEYAEQHVPAAIKSQITRKIRAMKAGTKTYFRLKPGPFKGK